MTVPVLVSNIIVLFVTHHFGGAYGINDYSSFSWAYTVPSVYIVAVPAVGASLDIIAVLSRNRVRRHEAVLVLVALFGIVGIGAWAQVPSTFDQFVYVALGLLAVVPALAIIGLVGDTLRNGRPDVRVPLLFAVGSLVMLLVGAGAGALSAIDGPRPAWDRLDRGGVPPRRVRRRRSRRARRPLVVGPEDLWPPPRRWRRDPGVRRHLPGDPPPSPSSRPRQRSCPRMWPSPQPGSSTERQRLRGSLNILAVVGSVLLVVGMLVALVAAIQAGFGRTSGASNPWGGDTLEWATTSPAEPEPTSPGPLRGGALVHPVLDESEA